MKNYTQNMSFFRNLILTIILLLSTQVLFTQTKVDSLNSAIDHAQGEKKLELLFMHANMYLETDELFNTAQRVEQEALQQKNMRYLAGSYMLKSRFFINSYPDSTIYYGELANQTYEKYNIKNPRQAYLHIADAYLHKGYYELAIYNIQKYLETDKTSFSAYSFLAKAYSITRNYDLAKESILQAIELFDLSTQKGDPHIGIGLYQVLADINTHCGAYEEALEACAIVEKILEQEHNHLQKTIVTLYTFIIYDIYTTIFIETKDVKRAKLYLNRTSQIPDFEYHDLLAAMRNNTLAKFYLLTNDSPKALICIDLALNYFNKENPNQAAISEVSELKIRILKSLNRFGDAFSLQQKLSSYNDSINQINLPLQLTQLSKNYELSKIRLEREKDKAELEKSEIINIGLITLTILLAIILFLIRRNIKDLKNKNRALYKQYLELDNFYNPTERTAKEEPKSLFDKIDIYMQEKEIYRQPNLTRTNLAEMLNTNRAYLTEAIKAETGKTFLEYINQYRLNYARIELMKDKSMPVNQIMYDSGFSSKSPFYRLFKDAFGLSPNELREVKERVDSEVLNSKKEV